MSLILNEWIFEIRVPKQGQGPARIRTENVLREDAAFVKLLARLAELWLNRRRFCHG